MTKDMIREWMTQYNHSRQWLADECGVTLKTVNNWLSTERGVPSKALRIIEVLMQVDHTNGQKSKPRLVLEFTKEEFERMSARALQEEMTVTQWAEMQLKKLTKMEFKEAKKKLRRSNQD